MRFIGAVGLLVCGACSTGEDNMLPPSEAGTVQLGILCNTFYRATGTFTPNTADPPPSGFQGCWPIGSWTFTLTQSTDESAGGGPDTCAGTPHATPPLSKYQFVGSTTLDGNGDKQEQFAYTAQPDDPNVHVSVKVTEGGSGICEGSLGLFDAAGTSVWTLKPELNADNTIAGSAEFDFYGSDQWGGSD